MDGEYKRKSTAKGKKKLPKAVYIRRRIMLLMFLCLVASLVVATPLVFRALIRERAMAENDILSFESDKAVAAAMQAGLKTQYTATIENTPSNADTDKPDVTDDAGNMSTATPTATALALASLTPPIPSPSPDNTNTPLPASTPGASAEPVNNDLPYYLYFEKGSFTLTIYEKDENGEYTKVYKTYRAAHGGNKTPAGKFELQSSRERWHEFPDGGFVQYAVRYHARLYLHSPLYGAEDAKILWPMYYDGEHGIGKESTGGCIRMVTEAARFIYENCPEGTIFEVVNGSPKNTTSDPPPSRNGKRVDPTDVNAN